MAQAAAARCSGGGGEGEEPFLYAALVAAMRWRVAACEWRQAYAILPIPRAGEPRERMNEDHTGRGKSLLLYYSADL